MLGMNVLLLKVPCFSYHDKAAPSNFAQKRSRGFQPSCALAALAAFVRTYRPDVRLSVVDANLLFLSQPEMTAEALYRHLESIIRESTFDVLAVSGQYMYCHPWEEEAARLARAKDRRARVIVGGGYATIFPEKVLRSPHVDYAVIGEGEAVLVHILGEIAGVRDLAFAAQFPFDGYGVRRADGRCEVVPKRTFLADLASLPPGDWEGMGLEAYARQEPGAYLPFMASRGCPNDCSYCSSRMYWGKRVRYCPAETVIEEIRRAHRALGVARFHCLDDNIAVNRPWFLDFCRRCGDLRPDVTITFGNFSVKTLGDDVLEALRDLGVRRIVIGVETGSPAVQKRVHKYLDLGQVEERFARVNAMGFQVALQWMIGFPGETLAEIEETVRMVRKLRCEYITMFPVFPFPGTRLYAEAKAQGLIRLDEDDFDSMDYQHAGKVLSDEW
ncbi:MAG: radical SAM protein, partial [Phycisphaerae bacterium]